MTDRRRGGPARRSTGQRLLRGAVLTLGAALLLLGLVLAAPFALRERAAHGPVGDTAAPLPGQALRATESLRALGYSCSDVVSTSELTTRACSRVNHLTSSSVRLALTTSTGALRLAVATTEDEGHAPQTYLESIGALGRALDLPADRQDQAESAAGARADAVTDLGWGSLTVRTAPVASATGSSATLRAADATSVGLGTSRTTLDVAVDTLARAAQAHGYTCTTAQVQAVRSCERVDGRYDEELSFQGTDRSTTEVYLSVASTYHRQTRSHWIRTMDQVMGWVGTDQSSAVRAWLAAGADAPGAAGYVDGLPVWFLVRTGTYTKETFGGIRADCAAGLEDLSSCDERSTPTGRPG